MDACDANEPATDVIATYGRMNGGDVEIRVDLLASPADRTADIYIALDERQGGVVDTFSNSFQWDWLIGIPASGNAHIFADETSGLSTNGIHLQTWYDSVLDSMVVRINGSEFINIQDLRFQVYTTLPGNTAFEDFTPPSFLLSTMPHSQAPLLLTFWDALPSSTPALVLRRWDGAHTGPLGMRHGLYRLLMASSTAGVPIFLNDLKMPSSLSALDYIGKTEWVRDLQSRGLVVLPDVAYGDPAAEVESLALSRKTGLDFGLAASTIAYGAMRFPTQSRFSTVFADLDDRSHISDISGVRMLPLPYSPYLDPSEVPLLDEQATHDGLSLAARKVLVETALSEDPADFVVLGGSLPASTWGDNWVAPQAFAYIDGHPWIHVLDESDVLIWPTVSGDETSFGCTNLLCAPGLMERVQVYTSQSAVITTPDASSLADQLRDQLQSAPESDLTRVAWDTYLYLTQPTNDLVLRSLRANELQQVKRLLEAARWAESPREIAECNPDEDSGECVLASKDMYAAIEQDGARLLLLVGIKNGRAHQWIGPTGQFAIGLSDPGEWQPSLGPAGDPAAIPGGFSDVPGLFTEYQADISPGRIGFSSNDGSTKIFRVIPGGVQVEYSTSGSIVTGVPFIHEPHFRFTPGWGVSVVEGEVVPLSILVRDGDWTEEAYFDSYNLMFFPEDPNQNFPAGHFLPFPIMLYNITGQNHLIVDITWE